MKSIEQLTLDDVEDLRKKRSGTNGKYLTVTEEEVKDMQKHLETLYKGKVQMNFAEKITYRNKAY